MQVRLPAIGFRVLPIRDFRFRLPDMPSRPARCWHASEPKSVFDHFPYWKNISVAPYP